MKWLFFTRLMRGPSSNQDLYYKYFDLKKQMTKTQLVSDMQRDLESVNREKVDLNKQNANLKFKCQILEVKTKGLRREIESHAVTIADLTAQIDEKMHTMRALEV